MIAPGDILQLVANFTLPDGEIAKNVFYYRIDDDASISQANIRNQLGNEIDNVYDGLGNNVANVLVAGNLDIYRRNTGTDQWDLEGAEPLNWSSANPGEPVSNQEAGVVFADTPNPRVTARKSIPGLLSIELETNSWSVAMQAALTAFAQRWINPANADQITVTSGCWSKVLNDFLAFNGSGTTRVFVGSMDTRKP